jgi:AraC-like DNA-binding protein
MIIDFGPTLRLLDAEDPRVAKTHKPGFIAGLHDHYALTETAGAMHGIEIRFTPIGARLFLGIPLADIANRVVGLDEVLGSAGPRLTERLWEAPDWPGRFTLLDEFIGARIADAPAVDGSAAWTWRQLDAAGGLLAIGHLAEQVGFSHKHLIAKFRREFGLPPKALARVLRFNRAVELLETGRLANWTEIALGSGFYDQAHMIRDFRQFTGLTPGAFARERDPGGALLDPG